MVNPLFENKYQVTFQNPQRGLKPSLSLESVAKPNHINALEVWDKAFRIFVGVFTQKYPLEAPHLMKYSEITTTTTGFITKRNVKDYNNL